MSLAAGILLVDKPAGVTSHDVVDWVRFVTRTPTGHAGTLDPAATGLLVVLLGAATKLSSTFAAEDKSYVAAFRLGIRTRSDDLDGEIIERVAVDDGMRARALARLQAFVGVHSLPPPVVSAVHVDGERAHVRARRGEVLELPPRAMTVFAVAGARLTRDGDLEAQLRVSKGTYIRALAAELGRQVGAPCTLAGLRRTHSGRFSLDGPGPWRVLGGFDVEPRVRPDGVPAVRLRLADPESAAAAAAPLDGPRLPPGAAHMARPGILSQEASRARIAAHVVPLTEAAGFPCLQADDEQARGWLRRLSLGQRLSAHEEGLCARLGRPPYAPESAASPDPGCGGQEGAAPAGPDSAHAALYGVLDAAGGPPILVLCAWSPAGDRLEPRRTVVLTGM